MTTPSAGGPPSPPTSGSTGSSGSSGSSSSSSGGSAPAPDIYGDTKAEQRAISAAVATAQNMVLSWGIPLTKQMNNLITRIVKGGGGSAVLLRELRKTKDYAERFKGIMRRDGTLRMSESAYLSGFNSAKDYAASIGRSLSIHQYGTAVKNGNSPAELKTKLDAVDKMREHSDILHEFSDYLVQTGQTKKPLTRKEMYAFVMKQGPKAWEQEWETAYTASQIERTGVLSVGDPAHNDLGYKGLDKLLKSADPNIDVTKMDWSDLADLAGQALPPSRLYHLGVTPQDLIKLKLKVPGSEKIAARIKLGIGTAEATATEQRANPSLTAQGLGGGQSQQQQATE